MSDFPALDDFNDFSSPSGGGGGGAQGDFLARERELLGDEFGPTPTGIPSAGDFEDDDKKARSSFPELDGDDFKSPPATSTGRPSNDFMSSFERDSPAAPAAAASTGSGPSLTSAKVEEDDDDDGISAGLQQDINKFQSQYPDLQVYPPADQQQQQQSSQYQNGFSSGPSQTPQPSATPAPAEPESDAIRAWREKQADEIAARDEASSKRKQEIIEKAEKAIDDFYATYNQKKEKQIAQNKENEAAYVQARDDALGRGTTWERIADLIELQDSRSKTVARGTKDLSRFKEVLLALKREGETAPNAAGY